MVDMPMPQRHYPIGYQIPDVFNDAADALDALRYLQDYDGKSHLAMDVLQKWIPAYVEESRRHMLHKFCMDQATATSKRLLSKVHEPYVPPYNACRIAVEIRFEEAKSSAQKSVIRFGPSSDVMNIQNIQEAELDPLKEFLEKFSDLEMATVRWYPQVRLISPLCSGLRSLVLVLHLPSMSMMLSPLGSSLLHLANSYILNVSFIWKPLTSKSISAVFW